MTQKDAMEVIGEIRKLQDLKHGADEQHSVAEWLLILEGQLRKAKGEWYEHGSAEALNRVAHIGACAVACIEQNCD
jgi:hypothetical protein